MNQASSRSHALLTLYISHQTVSAPAWGKELAQGHPARVCLWMYKTTWAYTGGNGENPWPCGFDGDSPSHVPIKPCSPNPSRCLLWIPGSPLPGGSCAL